MSDGPEQGQLTGIEYMTPTAPGVVALLYKVTMSPSGPYNVAWTIWDCETDSPMEWGKADLSDPHRHWLSDVSSFADRLKMARSRLNPFPGS